MKTADHLLIPTFSERKNIDPNVTNIGPPKVRLTTSANGIFLKAIKRAIIANVPDIALNACNFGLVVLQKVFNSFFGTNIKMGIKPKKNLANKTSPTKKKSVKKTVKKVVKTKKEDK